MAYLHNKVYDQGLEYLEAHGEDLHICEQEPATYTEATSTYTLGNETGITVGSPGDRGGGGREVEVGAITGGSVTRTETATHYAIVRVTSLEELLVAGALAASQSVTSGNTFDSAAFNVGIPAPA